MGLKRQEIFVYLCRRTVPAPLVLKFQEVPGDRRSCCRDHPIAAGLGEGAMRPHPRSAHQNLHRRQPSQVGPPALTESLRIGRSPIGARLNTASARNKPAMLDAKNGKATWIVVGRLARGGPLPPSARWIRAPVMKTKRTVLATFKNPSLLPNLRSPRRNCIQACRE